MLFTISRLLEKLSRKSMVCFLGFKVFTFKESFFFISELCFSLKREILRNIIYLVNIILFSSMIFLRFISAYLTLPNVVLMLISV